MSDRSRVPVILLGTAVAAVVCSVAVAIWILDSPAEERRQRLDQNRERDLTILASAVEDYFKHHKTLPADLGELTGWNPRIGRVADPITEEPYVYRPDGSRSYELCATFATTSSEDDEVTSYRHHVRDSFEEHPAGEHCFAMEVPDDAEP